MAGTLTINGLAAGLVTGEKIIGPITDSGSAVVGQITDLTLSSGDNTVTVPTGATHVLIVVGSTNTVQLKLRTNLNSGDGGTPFGPTGFVKWPLYTGTTSLIINAASGGATIELSFI